MKRRVADLFAKLPVDEEPQMRDDTSVCQVEELAYATV